METVIRLLEKGMNHIGVWWVLAIGILIGGFCLWLVLSLRMAYLSEENRELKYENAYFRERDQVQTRIYDRLKVDLADKVFKHEFDKICLQHETPDDDSDDVPEPEREPRKVCVQDPANPDRWIFVEVQA